MKIVNKNNELILDVEVDDSSFSSRSIMGDKTLTLNYSLTGPVEIPTGSRCEFKGINYYLFRPENFKKNNTRNFEYTLLLETEQALLRNFRFNSVVDIPPRLKFSYTGTPDGFLKLLIDNLNRPDNPDRGWSVGIVAEAKELTLDFNNQSCMDALNRIAEAFNTEWSIEGKVISLGKVDKNKELGLEPVALAYGEGQGLKPGVGRSNYDNSTAITRLYVVGGERNVDLREYGANALLLPKETTIEYEGRTYKSNEFGTSIERVDKPADVLVEGSLDLSHIYPKRVGTVSKVIAVDDSMALYDFEDDSIPDDLDFNNYLIPDTKMIVVFQNNKKGLAGKEFEISKYDHTNRLFQLVPVEDGGYPMPKGDFVPQEGDEYGVFQIRMPESYIQEASQSMLEEAARYLYENEDPRFTFTGELDPVFAKKNWSTIGGFLDVGYSVNFTDPQFQQEPVAIRITGIKEYVNNPYAPQLELSNVSAKNTFANKMAEINNQEVTNNRKDQDNYEFTKRRWRDAKETQQNMFDVLTNYFTEGISPISVETMQVLVGSPALQFIFLETKNSTTEVDPGINWSNEDDKIHVLSGTWLKHMTLGIGYIGGQHAANEYIYWNMPAWQSGAIADADDEKIFYLYAKCSTLNETGQYLLSPDQITMEQYKAQGYYHFLIGILNTKFDGERSFAELYGFTEILPGQITANRFQSTDGYQYWDFTKKQFHIGDQYTGIDWNVRNPDKLTIRGGIIQDPGGNKDGITVWRGTWISSATYYLGNEVTWNGNTYRYVNTSATSGNQPDNLSYWVMMSSYAESAELVTLNATSLMFKYGKGFAGTPTPSTIRLTATVQNIKNPSHKWYWSSGNGIWNAFGGLSEDYFRDIAYYDNIFTNNAVTIRCTVNGTFSDQMTIVKVADGDDSYTVILENEAHTVACNSQGVPGDGELGSGGKARTRVIVFKGSTQLTAVANNPGANSPGIGKFSVAITSDMASGNCSASFISGKYDEIYVGSMGSSSDNAQVFLSIYCESTSVIARKEMSLTKSKQGADGESASLLSIRSTGQIFKYADPEYSGVPSPSYIDLLAVLQNATGTVNWYYLNGFSEVAISTGTSLRVNYDAGYLSNVLSRTIRTKTTVDGQIITDEITIAKLADGSDAYTCILTNEAVTLPATPEGDVSNYSQATTKVELYYGSKQILPDYKIGSPNLILKSDNMYNIANKTMINGSIGYDISDPTDNDLAAVIRKTSSAQAIFRISNVVSSNGTYSFGVWMKGYSETKVKLDICDLGVTEFTVTTEWKYYTITANVTNYNASTHNYVDIEPQIQGVYVEIWHPMLIKSGNPEPWAQNPGEILYNFGYNNGMSYQKSGNSTVSITSMSPTIDSGYIDIYIAFRDFNTVKRFSIAKSKQGQKGDSGEQGMQGPGLVWRGLFNTKEDGSEAVMEYYGSTERRDIVKYADNNYYIAKKSAGSFSSNNWQSDKWESFGAQFSSVATGLMFAETALISGWYFNKNKIWSQNAGKDGNLQGLYLDGNTKNKDGQGNYDNPAVFMGNNVPNSAPTRLYEDGRIYTTKLEAVEGRLGNHILIRGEGLTNEGFGSDDYIILRNDNKTQFMGVGAVGPNPGFEALGRFENDYASNSRRNFGIVVSAADASGYNGIGISVTKGNVIALDSIYSTRYNFFVPSSGAGGNNILPIEKGNNILVNASGSSNTVYFPFLNSIQSMLGADTFAIRITVIAVFVSPNFLICAPSGCTFYNHNGGVTSSILMAKGDCCEILLAYDGNSYFAQIINLNQ